MPVWPQKAMRQQLVFSLSLFFAMYSPVALGQTSSIDDQLNAPNSQNQNVDCTDPFFANSPVCQTNLGNPSQQGVGAQGIAAPQVNSRSGIAAQSGMTRPQTYTDINPYYLQSQYSSLFNLQPLPPQPLTDFQKFVAGTTSEVLPIFGASLFQNAPSTFAPINEASIPPDYVIGPGDVLRIRLWGQIDFNANVHVDRAGEIYLPKVGPIHVAGLPYQDLNQHLREAIGRVFRNFDLTSDVGEIRAIQVYIVGQAHRPGTYTVSSLSTLVDALFESGGPSVQGSMRHIYLKRGGSTVAD